MALSASPSSIYDWSDPAQLDDWVSVISGGGSISIDQSTDELVLAPQQNSINHVAVRRTGAFNRVDIWVTLTGESAANSKYFDISIGSGPVTDTNTGGLTAWWHASLDTSVIFATQAMGSASGAYIREKIEGAPSQAFEPVNFPNTLLNETKITFVIDAGYARVYYDDVFQAEWPTTLLDAGDILIHQGEYVSGNGSIARISRIEIWTFAEWFISGNVTTNGMPANADVRLYHADTGQLYAATISDVNGNYLIDTPDHAPFYVFASLSADYPPIVHGPVIPKLKES
ncbi:hypothetical protein [Neptunomonas sp.]|uniref:hypothetical protein n=1 Tax=Neptunomonas sp. TaxID=1971898 RepID=UPI0025F7C541|nr:hypothetical protein [Neptunomonas sp.]